MRHNERWDARDLSKVGFLSILHRPGLLLDLKVFPMLTGAPFTEGEWATYAQMLGVSSSDLLNIRRFEHNANYFAAAAQFPCSDIFADAGTGIAEEDQQQSREHITTGEISWLLPPASNRILIVFQSRPNHNFANAANVECMRGETFRTAIRTKLERLAVAGFSCFAFHDSTVNFILVSRQPGRVEQLLHYLREGLGTPSKRLICPAVQAGEGQAA